MKGIRTKCWLSNFTLKAKGNAVLYPGNNENQAISIYIVRNALEIYLTTRLIQ